SECAWGGEAGWQKMIGYRAEEEILYSRIYLADELEFFEENQWIFSECQGVSIACRSIRGELIAEASNDWIPGQVLRSEIPDDVILVTVAETAEVGGFDKFRQTICESGRLSWDDKQVSFTDLNGSVLVFSWKEDADPTVNGRVPSYEHIRFEDPLVKSKRGSGIICIDSSDSQCILDAFSPDTMNRRDCPK
ncbi:MAG: hypothetical protein HRT89_23005, partial [Lentisphaeria bacterium]|nr:hypothetical protein [Lentisphaeria bacterium]